MLLAESTWPQILISLWCLKSRIPTGHGGFLKMDIEGTDPVCLHSKFRRRAGSSEADRGPPSHTGGMLIFCRWRDFASTCTCTGCHSGLSDNLLLHWLICLYTSISIVGYFIKNVLTLEQLKIMTSKSMFQNSNIQNQCSKIVIVKLHL